MKRLQCIVLLLLAGFSASSFARIPSLGAKTLWAEVELTTRSIEFDRIVNVELDERSKVILYCDIALKLTKLDLSKEGWSVSEIIDSCSPMSNLL